MCCGCSAHGSENEKKDLRRPSKGVEPRPRQTRFRSEESARHLTVLRAISVLG